jgi:hypothetical protein
MPRIHTAQGPAKPSAVARASGLHPTATSMRPASKAAVSWQPAGLMRPVQFLTLTRAATRRDYGSKLLVIVVAVAQEQHRDQATRSGTVTRKMPYRRLRLWNLNPLVGTESCFHPLSRRSARLSSEQSAPGKDTGAPPESATKLDQVTGQPPTSGPSPLAASPRPYRSTLSRARRKLDGVSPSPGLLHYVQVSTA